MLSAITLLISIYLLALSVFCIQQEQKAIWTTAFLALEFWMEGADAQDSIFVLVSK